MKFNNLYRVAYRTLLATIALGLISVLFIVDLPEAGGKVKVRGYYRKDGTYVRPHYRSAPDGNPYNNWSYPGNTNPVTGNVASGNPDTYLKNYYNRRSNPTYYSYSPSSILPYLLGSTTLNVTPTKKTSQEERSLRRLFIDSSVIELQSFLKLNSFDPGPTDGIYGPRTRRAYNLYIESLTPQIVSTSGYSSENQSIRDKIEDILQLKKPIALPQKSKPDIVQQATEDFKRGYDLESSIQKVLKKGRLKKQ